MFKLLWQKKFLIIFLAIILALLPVAATKQPVVLSKALVTCIGIDYSDGVYSVYGEKVIFNFDPFGVLERKVLSGDGDSFEDAMREIERSFGRKISFTHCTLIILGNGLVEHNSRDEIVHLLEYFYERRELSNAAAVIHTTSDLEKLIETSNKLGDVQSGLLQRLVEFNRRDREKSFINLEDLFKRYKRGRPINIPIINEIDGALENEGNLHTI